MIQSKCGQRIPSGWALRDPVSPETFGEDFGPDLSRRHIVSAVEGSLRRLATDRLDVLLLHLPDPLAEPEEIAQAFDELHSSGKVRYFGVSNYSVVQIELLRKCVHQRLIANQIQLSLAHYFPIAERSSYGGLVDYCRLHQMHVQAYSPLRGKDLLAAPPLLNPPADATPQFKQVAQMLMDVAKRHDATPAAIMLSWLLRHPAGIVPIIGASKPEHIIANCVADRVRLGREEWHTLFNAAESIQSNA